MLQLPMKSSTHGRSPKESSIFQSINLAQSTWPLPAWVSSIKWSIASSDHNLPLGDTPARQQGTAWCGKSRNWLGSLESEASSLQPQSPKSTWKSSTWPPSTATTRALQRPSSDPNCDATNIPTTTSSTVKFFRFSTEALNLVSL